MLRTTICEFSLPHASKPRFARIEHLPNLHMLIHCFICISTTHAHLFRCLCLCFSGNKKHVFCSFCSATQVHNVRLEGITLHCSDKDASLTDKSTRLPYVVRARMYVASCCTRFTINRASL